MILHQAIDSITGDKYQWQATSYDYLATGYPGPNLPTNLIVLAGLGAGRNAALSVPAYKTWIQAGDGSAPIGVQWEIHVDQFLPGGWAESSGSTGNGTDSTAAIQAAIDYIEAHSAAGGAVVIGAHNYRVTSTISISMNSVHIKGYGKGSSTLVFDPAGHGTACVKVAQGGTGTTDIDFNSVRDFKIIMASGNIYQAEALDLYSVGEFELAGVQVEGFTNVNGTAPSIGIHTHGHEMVSIHHCRVTANRPMYIDQASQVSLRGFIDLDQTNIENNLFYSPPLPAPNASLAWPIIEVEGHCAIQAFHVTGYNSWDGGNDGFRFVRSIDSTASQSQLIEITGPRLEQQVVTGGFFANIQANVQQLTVSKFVSDRSGVKLRYVGVGTIEKYMHIAGPVAYDVDSCEHIDIIQCYVGGNYGVTASIGDMIDVLSTPRSVYVGDFPPNRVLQNAPGNYYQALARGLIPWMPGGYGPNAGVPLMLEGAAGQWRNDGAANNSGGDIYAIGGSPGAGSTGPAGGLGSFVVAQRESSGGLRNLLKISKNLNAGDGPILNATSILINPIATHPVCAVDFSGIITLHVDDGNGNGTACDFTIKGSAHSTVRVGTDTDFGVSVGSSVHNVYWDGTNYVYQNNSVNVLQFSVIARGASPANTSLFGGNGRATFTSSSVPSSAADGSPISWVSQEGTISLGAGLVVERSLVPGNVYVHSASEGTGGVSTLGVGTYNGLHTPMIVGVRFRFGPTVTTNKILVQVTSAADTSAISAYVAGPTSVLCARHQSASSPADAFELTTVAANTEQTVVWVLHTDGKWYNVSAAGTSAGVTDVTTALTGLITLAVGGGPGDVYFKNLILLKPGANPLSDAQALYTEMAI